MSLTLILLAITTLLYWAGFRAPRHPLQYQSKAGFFVLLGLSCFSGYFAWREARTVGELRELIDPVPEMTDLTYMPTSGEVAALSQLVASVPGGGRFGSGQEERAGLVGLAGQRGTQYWLLGTALGVDSTLTFYRGAAVRRGWTIEMDKAPWLSLSRGAETLLLFVSDDFPRPRTKVLYILEAQEG